MTASVDKHFIKGATTTLILSLLNERPMHGYELTQTIKTRSKGIFSFSEGTVYPMLYSLEDKGYVKGTWDISQGSRRKKVYRLTPTGRKVLQKRLEQWLLFKRGMDLAAGEV
jgi:PadR family transcriptional regulator PadR